MIATILRTIGRDAVSTGRMRPLLLLSFVPYLIIGLIHLAALFFGLTSVEPLSKLLLMPALLIGLAIALPRRRGVVALLGSLGILFSWAGDILLATPGGLGFLIGLGAFLLAHVAYLVLFVRVLRERRTPWAALVLILWWGGLLALLAPSIGILLIPVAIYGLVLGAYAAAALACNPLVAAGGVLVLVSDSVLALKLFLPGFSLWEHDFLIMLAYIVGQGLVTIGVVTASQLPARALTAKAVS